MAVKFKTSAPQVLLDKFNAAIDQTEAKGKITTWVRDSAGDFTHKADDWNQLAWMCPKIEQGQLRFTILHPTGKTIKTVTYAYYHGHLIETFLAHFDSYFTDAIATALIETGDSVAP